MQRGPGLFITGTDTEVGKTYVGAMIARALAAAAKSQAKIKLEMPETSMTPRETSGRPAASGTDAWIQAPRR